ncbi:Protein ALH-4 a [Aphelenchoides avenae]|nr:Protein ALH-4 a [Aphelenchus avenae]
MYTGCTPVAKIIMGAASKHVTPLTLELGGKCPVIVEPDADLAISAKRIAWGKWMNNGQTCLAPDYILATEPVKKRLVEEMQKVLKDFYGSDISASADYSRIINERHYDRISSLLDTTDATVLYKGGERNRSDRFIPPYILDAKPSDVVMQDEIFGPILPIVTVRNFSEALELIRKGEKPLAAYLFTRDEDKVERLLKETYSGGVTINDVLMHMTVDTLPFGGTGHSGMGRYRGKFGFDEFTHEKAVLKRGFFGEGLAAARYPPLTDKKVAQLKQLGTRRTFPKVLRTVLWPIPYIVIGVIIGVLAQRFGVFGR